MSVIDLLKGNYSSHVLDAWTPLRPQGSSWYKEQFTDNAAGVAVSPDSALNSSTALACTRAISETLASLPAVVHERVGNDAKRKARENPMWALLHDQPNPQMDSMSWYQINATRVINRGNSVNLIEYNGRGLPIALWPVHNSRFQIFRMKSMRAENGRFIPGNVFYRIWPDETERSFDVGPEEILNIVSWDSEDGLIGRGVVRRMKQEIALDVAMQEFAASMFKNSALPMGLIKHPWIDDPTDRENFRADINSLHAGRENWNKVGILWDKDADWVKLSFSPEDLQAISSRQFSAKAICRGYNVPPAIVQIFEDYKFATVEAMLKHFIMLGIRPYAIRFERAINSQILSMVDEDLMLEFALEGLLRGDPEKQAKMNAIYRGWGILDADEIRQRDLGMNPLPNGIGEVRLAPLNHAPLEQIAGGQQQRNQRGGNQQQQRAAVWDPAYVASLAKPDVRAASERIVKQEMSSIRGRTRWGSDGFLKWIDNYYSRLETTLAYELTHSGVPVKRAATIASEYTQESKHKLLAACECQPQEFAKSINACVTGWLDRIDHIVRRAEE